MFRVFNVDEMYLKNGTTYIKDTVDLLACDASFKQELKSRMSYKLQAAADSVIGWLEANDESLTADI